jgi:catechol 2,3-dioxygenase-like lactoylglutathione lyase family enzyme
MFLGLRSTIYPAPDMEASKAFFTRILGVEPYFDEPAYAGYSVAGFELGLFAAGDPTDGATTYWGVRDVEAALAGLVAAGAVPRDPVTDVGGGIKMATVVEPGGTLLGIIENPVFTLTDPPVGSELPGSGL